MSRHAHTCRQEEQHAQAIVAPSMRTVRHFFISHCVRLHLLGCAFAGWQLKKLFKLLVFDVKEGWFHQHISFEVKDTDFRGSLRSNFKDFQSSIGVVGACACHGGRFSKQQPPKRSCHGLRKKSSCGREFWWSFVSWFVRGTQARVEAGARVRAARQQAGSDPFFARNAEQNQTSSVYPTEAFKLFKLLVFDVKEGWFHQHISFEVKDTDFRGSLRSNFKDFQSSIGVVGACLPWRTLLEATASETLLSRAQEKIQLWPGVLVVLRFVVCAWDAGTRGGWSSRPSCKTAAGRKRPVFCRECGTKPNKLRIPHRSL